MNKLTRMVALLKRVRRKPELAACAMAALLFLSALAVPARAQNTYGGSTFVHAGSIGLVPGQTVSITVPNSYFENGSVKFLKSSVLRVYDREGHGVTERESGLVYSGESGGLNEAMHIFTFSYSDLPVSGDPRTGRKDVWLEVESFPRSPTTTSVDVLIQNANDPPSCELIDPDGKTTIFRLLSPAIRREGQYECRFCEKALSSTSTPVQAQEVRSFYAFGNFQGGVSVGAAAGQTIRILVEAADAAPPSLNKPSGDPGVIVGSATSAMHVKAFNAATGALLWSRELTRPTPGLHIFDINRDELREVGNPGTGRVQFRIELAIDGMNVSRPAFEVFDNESGRTTVRGGTGRLVLAIHGGEL